MSEKKVFQINIPGKLFYTLIAVFALVVVAVGVYALDTNNPSTFGHSFGEIKVPDGCSSGMVLTYNPSSTYGPWVCGSAGSGIGTLIRVTDNFYNANYAVVGCPSGYYAIGGGCSAGAYGADSSLETSYPYLQTYWACNFKSSETQITAHVICAKANSYTLQEE